MKQITTKSYNFCQALTAIQALTQEELIFLKKELEKQASKEKKCCNQKNRTTILFFFLVNGLILKMLTH